MDNLVEPPATGTSPTLLPDPRETAAAVQESQVRLSSYREFHDFARGLAAQGSPERLFPLLALTDGGLSDDDAPALTDLVFNPSGRPSLPSLSARPLLTPEEIDNGIDTSFGGLIAANVIRHNSVGSFLFNTLGKADAIFFDGHEEGPAMMTIHRAGQAAERVPFDRDRWMIAHFDIMPPDALDAWQRGDLDWADSENQLLHGVGMIQERIRAQRKLEGASFGANLLAGVVGQGFLDPTNYVAGRALGRFIKAREVVQSARVGGAAIGAGARLSNVLIRLSGNAGLTAAQEFSTVAGSMGTKSNEEALANIGFAMAFDAVAMGVGGLVHGRLKPSPRITSAGRIDVTPAEGLGGVVGLQHTTAEAAAETARAAATVEAAIDNVISRGLGDMEKSSPLIEIMDPVRQERAQVRFTKAGDGVAYAIEEVNAAGETIRRQTGSAARIEDAHSDVYAALKRDGWPMDGVADRIKAAPIEESGMPATAAVGEGVHLSEMRDAAEASRPAAAAAEMDKPAQVDNYQLFTTAGLPEVGSMKRKAVQTALWIFGNTPKGRLAMSENGPVRALVHSMFEMPGTIKGTRLGLAGGRPLEDIIRATHLKDRSLIRDRFEKSFKAILAKRAGLDVGTRGGGKAKALEAAVELVPVWRGDPSGRMAFNNAVGILSAYDDPSAGGLAVPFHVEQELAKTAQSLGMSLPDLRAAAKEVYHAAGDPRVEAAAAKDARGSMRSAQRAGRRNSVVVVTVRENAGLSELDLIMRELKGLDDAAPQSVVFREFLDDNGVMERLIQSDPRQAAERIRDQVNLNYFGNVDKATARRLLMLNSFDEAANVGRPVVRMDFLATVDRTTKALQKLEALESLRRFEDVLADPASPAFDWDYRRIAPHEMRLFYEDGAPRWDQEIDSAITAEIEDRLSVLEDRAVRYAAERNRQATIETRDRLRAKQNADLATALRKFRDLAGIEDGRGVNLAETVTTRSLSNMVRATYLTKAGLTQLSDVALGFLQQAIAGQGRAFLDGLRPGVERVKSMVRNDPDAPALIKSMVHPYEGMTHRMAEMYGSGGNPLTNVTFEGAGARVVNVTQTAANITAAGSGMQIVTDTAKHGATWGFLSMAADTIPRMPAVLERMAGGMDVEAAAKAEGVRAINAKALLDRIPPEHLRLLADAYKAGEVEWLHNAQGERVIPVPRVTRQVPIARVLNDLPTTRAGLERLLRDELEGFVDEGDLEDVAFEKGQAAFSTSFYGPLPAEVKEAIGGKEGGKDFGLMSKVRTNTTYGGAEDFIEEFGVDEWVRRLRLTGNSGRIEEVLRMAPSHPNPAIRFAAWLYDRMAGEGAGSFKGMKNVPIGVLQDGDAVSVGGKRLVASRIGDDIVHLSGDVDGEDWDFATWDSIPVDRESADAFAQRIDQAEFKARAEALARKLAQEDAAEAEQRALEEPDRRVAKFGPQEQMGQWTDPAPAPREPAASAEPAPGQEVGQEVLPEPQRFLPGSDREFVHSRSEGGGVDRVGPAGGGPRAYEADRLTRFIARAASIDDDVESLIIPWTDDAPAGRSGRLVMSRGADGVWMAFDVDDETGEVVGLVRSGDSHTTLRDALVEELTPDTRADRPPRTFQTTLAELQRTEAARKARATQAALTRTRAAEGAARRGRPLAELRGVMERLGLPQAEANSLDAALRTALGDDGARGIDAALADALSFVSSKPQEAAALASGALGDPREFAGITVGSIEGSLRAVMSFVEGRADAESLLHEMTHLAHALADDRDWAMLQRLYTKGTGAWTRESAERVVRDILRYQRSKPERFPMAVRSIVHKLRAVLGTAVSVLTRGKVQIDMVDPRVADFAARWWNGEVAQSLAFKSEDGAHLKRGFAERRAEVQRRLGRFSSMLDSIGAQESRAKSLRYEEAVESLIGAGNRDVNQNSVITPSALSRPLVADTPLGSLLWNFMGYPAEMGTSFLLRSLDQTAAHNSLILGTLVSAATATLMLKAWVKGEDPDDWLQRQSDNPAGFAFDVVSQAGLMGLVERPVRLARDAAEGGERGFGARDLVGQVLPVAGLLNDYGKTMGDLLEAAGDGSMTDTEMRSMYRMLILGELLPIKLLGRFGREGAGPKWDGEAGRQALITQLEHGRRRRQQQAALTN